jgi:azurin
MKMKLIPILTLTALGLLAGCSKAPTTTGGTPAQPKADPNLPEKAIEITANDQMKFNVTTLDVRRAQKVKLTLKNIGTMPKASMGHNWVLLDRGADPQAFVDASQMQFANEHIAPEMKNKVLANTKLLGPGESETIEFVAPSIPGSYTFLCSFPGHFPIGMKGTLRVQ